MQPSTPPPARFSRTLTRAIVACALLSLALGVHVRAQEAPRPANAAAPARASSAEKDDGRFHLVLGAFITAAGTDVASSMYQIGKGNAREAGFGAPWQDSPVAFAATKSALTALFAYQLQHLHKTRPKTALILGLVGTGVEVALVARTAHLQTPVR